MIDIKNNERSFLKGLAIIKFTASWCGPCKVAQSTYLKMEEEFPQYTCFTIDVDDNSELAEAYGIRSVPTFVILRDGAELCRFSGAVYTTPFRKQLRDLLK
jgi:thioredoxin 1